MLSLLKSVIDGHFVLHDLFIYYLNWMGMMSKVVVRKVDRSYYGQVMAIFLLACKEMATRMKKLLVLLHFEFHWLVSLMSTVSIGI